MSKRITQWIDGLTLTYKVTYAIASLFFLAFLLEYFDPYFKWKVLLKPLHDWFICNFLTLLRLFFCGVALLTLYVFLFRGKVILFFEALMRRRVRLVIFIGIVEGILVYNYWDDLIGHFRAKDGDGDPTGQIPIWLGTFVTTLVISPIAFVIWSFRNEDKRKDLQQTQENLQHTEENIRQSNFLKIEEWATTSPRTKKWVSETEVSAVAGEQSKSAIEMETNPNQLESDVDQPDVRQVVAIYQLLPYLKGEYGKHFVRPAMEIYRSLLSTWQIDEQEKKTAVTGDSSQIKKPPYIDALHVIFNQQYEFFRLFHKQSVCEENDWIPLSDIDLKVVKLADKDFSGAVLSKADLKYANLRQTRLINANLSYADLSGAILIRADLSEADLRWADLSGADLRMANLIHADLSGAIVVGTDLCGANLTDASYDEIDIKETRMDEYTTLRHGSRWEQSETRMNEYTTLKRGEHWKPSESEF